MNSTIFVPYIFIKDEYGYVLDTKFKKEISINHLPQVGQPITNFYNEIYPFFNFCSLKLEDNQQYIIDNNSLIPISESQAREKIINLFNDFLSILHNVDCVDLHSKRSVYDNSNYEQLKQGLEISLNTSFVNNTQKSFTFDLLQNIENELNFYSSLDKPNISSIVYPAIKGINTILAMNNIIENVNNDKFFYHYGDESYSDENLEKLGLDYTSANQGIHNIEKIAYIIRDTSNKHILKK